MDNDIDRFDSLSLKKDAGAGMRISWDIALFELRRLQKSLLILLPVFFMMSALALYSGAIQLRHQHTNTQLLAENQQTYLNKQVKKVEKRIKELKKKNKPISPDRKIYRNPAFLAQHGTPAIIPAGPAALISVGVTPLQAQSIQVTLDDPALLESQENLQHPLQLWAGHFDLVFVLVYLMPLFLIAISFDLTASEQESGNLKLLLVQGGGLLALIKGKVLARLWVLVFILVSLSLMIWGFVTFNQIDFAWTRWCLAMVLSLMYGSIWMSLAAFLNAKRWKPSNIAASLASIWLLAVWVIPGANQQLIQGLLPVPSRMDYIQSYREAAEQVRQESSKLLGKYMEDHPEIAGGTDNKYAVLQLSKAQAMAKAIRPVVNTYQDQLAQQQKLAAYLQYLSPASVFESILSQLAGSDLNRQQAYRSQVVSFQAQWTAFFLPLIQSNQALEPQHFQVHPHFKFQEVRLVNLNSSIIAAFIVLLGLTSILSALSLRAYHSYQIIETNSN